MGEPAKAIFLSYSSEDTGAAKRICELAPNSGLIRCFMSAIHLFRGDAAAALEMARTEVLPEFRSFGVALAEHALGHVPEANAALTELIEKGGDGMAYQIAEVYGYREEDDRAFEWLEKAFALRDPGLAHTLADTLFSKRMRADPRWLPFITKMGFS